MSHEAWIFRLSVRCVGLVLSVIWAPQFLGLALSWIIWSLGWVRKPPSEWPSSYSSGDWVVYIAPSALGVAMGLYLLVDGRMVIEGLYPSLRPAKSKAAVSGDAQDG